MHGECHVATSPRCRPTISPLLSSNLSRFHFGFPSHSFKFSVIDGKRFTTRSIPTDLHFRFGLPALFNLELILPARFPPIGSGSLIQTFPPEASARMMVDSGSTTNQVIGNMISEKGGDGGCVSGGWKSEDGKLSYGYSSFRGKRATMEDFYDIRTSKINGKTVCMFGIFDGHGGSHAAEYLKQHLFENLMKHPKFMSDTKLAISETYPQTDVDFLDSERDAYRDDGSTASTAVLVGNHLYVANVGDSRTIISKAGEAIPLSEDHKPNRSDERKRIENAGGVVMWAGTWRVGGVLAMSRAFGDRMLKQFVVAEPEIQDAVSLAGAEQEPETAARKLIETAFTRGSADNITCIVVRFHHDKAVPVHPKA